jgi:menaquinone-dependent protoporphyrinogen oxidase
MERRREKSMRRVLLVWESKHGSTTEISYAIAGVLRAHSVGVRLSRAEEADIDDTYDAFIIGSAVHAGDWMRHAKEFVRDYRHKLQARPVWLFSGGPAVDVAEMVECTAAEDHGDFRNFDDIKVWASQIAKKLNSMESLSDMD